MEADLQDRIAALRASRRAGATASENDTCDAWLAEWAERTHIKETQSTRAYAEANCASFDRSKLNVISADVETDAQPIGSSEFESKILTTTFVFWFPDECSDLFVQRNAPTVLLVLALGVIDAMKAIVPASSTHSFGIKWPNAILVDGKHLAVLSAAEMSQSRADPVIATLSLVVESQQPSREADERASDISFASLAAEVGAANLDKFRDKLQIAFAASIRKFFVSGFAELSERVNSCMEHADSLVKLKVSDSTTVEGTCAGVNASGHLVLRREDGKVKGYPFGEIHIGDSSLKVDSTDEVWCDDLKLDS